MKAFNSIWIWLFLGGLCAGFSQETLPSNSLVGDPVCGFIAGPHFTCEAAEVKQGLTVELLAGDVRAGQPATLRFLVEERPRNTPEDGLQVEHEKLMHVIGVGDDLNGFFHIHPLKVSSGMWEVSHAFAKGGNYKIWVDVKSRGVTYSFGQPILRVTENPGGADAATNHATAACKLTAQYQVQIRNSENLFAGATNEISFLVKDQAGVPVELENFLGTSMHLVIVKDDLSEYLHAHPEGRDTRDGAIRFRQVFSTPGRYKMFAQFRPKIAQLPPDEAVPAEFSVSVFRAR